VTYEYLIMGRESLVDTATCYLLDG